MSLEKELNVVWETCHHGVQKRYFCAQCADEKQNTLSILMRAKAEGPRRIPIKRGCEAAAHGGCFCTGRCNEIIGYRDPLPGE